MSNIASSSKFDGFIMVLIIISSISLALENPLNDPDSSLVLVLLILDYITTIFFTIEVMIKVISYGFFLNGPKSYIHNVWNLVDLIIVLTSLLALFQLPLDLRILKVIRMVRLLRPIRLLSKNENLKLSMQALVVSIPPIVNLLVIVLLVYFIFAIIGINLFKGKSYYCFTEEIRNLSPNDIEKLIVTDKDCLNYGG
jgi:hypothetical protein